MSSKKHRRTSIKKNDTGNVIIALIVLIVALFSFSVSLAIALILLIIALVCFLVYFETNHYKNVPNFDSMSGKDFERFCCFLLNKNGFGNIQNTRTSGDQGIDIIATYGNLRYGIQCKRYNSNVGNAAIQQVYTGIKFYKCDKGAVITNQHFTKSAKELANSIGVELWDREKLYSLINFAYKDNDNSLSNKGQRSAETSKNLQSPNHIKELEVTRGAEDSNKLNCSEGPMRSETAKSSTSQKRSVTSYTVNLNDEINNYYRLLKIINTTTEREKFESAWSQIQKELILLSAVEKEHAFSFVPSQELQGLLNNEDLFRQNLEKRISEASGD